MLATPHRSAVHDIFQALAFDFVVARPDHLAGPRINQLEPQSPLAARPNQHWTLPNTVRLDVPCPPEFNENSTAPGSGNPERSLARRSAEFSSRCSRKTAGASSATARPRVSFKQL